MPKFGYAVKYNGKYYPAGADIPEVAQKAASAASDTQGGEESAKKSEVAQKATKVRKKGDA